MASKKTPPKKVAPAKKPAVKKKVTGKKTAGKKAAGKKKQVNSEDSFLGMIFRRLFMMVFFVAVSLGAGVGYFFITDSDTPAPAIDHNILKSPGIEKPRAIRDAMPAFEIFPDAPVVTQPKPSPVLLPGLDERPRVAIIIDDIGYDLKLAEKFLSLDARITYAILPHSPHRHHISNAARLKGHEVMLHLPMEPTEYPEIDPGPGALLSSMTPDERIAVLKQNIDSVPFISGVNNHMGSKMTANSEQMNQVLSIMKKKGLYYIDSVTTHKSHSQSSARLFQVPFARRDVFLDHDPDPEAIRKQINRLVRIAELNGHAVGIGHPYEVTYEILAESLPMLRDRVQLIPASEAVRLADY